MTDIDCEDHAALILDVDDHPVAPDPKSEESLKRASHRFQEVPRIISALNLPQLADHTHLNTAIESAQRILGARSQFNDPVRHLPLPLRWRPGPQALMEVRREVVVPWAPAAASVNICRSMYSPFLPMLKDFTGRK